MSYASHQTPEIFDADESAPIQNDPFLGLEFFAREFGLSTKHLAHVSEQQRGLFKKKQSSDRALRRYPKLVKGPGGRIGMYLSDYIRWKEESR